MMDNQEKIYHKIKQAAQNQDPADFRSMEKVWSRLEDKLDHKVLAKQSSNWKKLAVAASVLLVATLGGVLYHESENVATPEKQIVIIESSVSAEDSKQADNTIVGNSPKNPEIKKNANQILQNQIKQNATAVADVAAAELEEQDKTDAPMPAAAATAVLENESPGKFMRPKAFNAKGIVRPEAEAAGDFQREKSSKASTVVKKEAPLIVIDGEPMTGEKAKEAQLNPDIQDIVVLKEPLYIINGHYYTEQELFGPNPTSPYAPLNQQEIETISILQGEKAVANYGKKGEKGVVIITTKNQKPVERATPAGKTAEEGR